MTYRTILLFLAIHFPICCGYSQTNLLRNKIAEIVKSKQATIGVAILDFENKDTLTYNNDFHFPMQSVYKFHLAFAVLNQVDAGKLSLNQKIYLTKTDLLPDTWSPLRDKYPAGNVEIPLSEIISYTVSQSDNNGCDILFRLLGGPQKINQYIHNLGIKDVAIVATEEEMHKDWNVQYTNWSTPFAATKLLEKFYRKKILSKSSQDFLWKIMVETTTGPNKIKGFLPKDVIVGHKTGFSGANKEGLTGATNDIGIIKLPSGKQFAISVFVCNSKEDEKTNDRVIAEISKAAWDYYSGK
ncbi:MAG: class A beta-lactamase, subclass A2 [Bacteroidota bacterium]|jgi:beta-lactamase class A